MPVWDCDGRVCKFSPIFRYRFHANCSLRSMPQESLARRVVVPLFSNRTATSTVLVARVFTTIPSRGGCCIITMLTRILGMLMGRSNSVGTRLRGRTGGRRYRYVFGPSTAPSRPRIFQSIKAHLLSYNQSQTVVIQSDQII